MSETMTRYNGAQLDHDDTLRRIAAAALPPRIEILTPADDMSRRDAIRVLMGASSALALGLSGCERKPKRQIISRVTGPEYQHPGEALYYSSTWTEGPFPYGLMIKTVDGRPIKIEGNPDHPINRGSTSAAMQASVLSLYDPDRLREPQDGAGPISWDAVDRRVIEALKGASSVALVTGANLGPSMGELIDEFLSAVPGAVHFVHESVHDGPRRSAWNKAYGLDGDLLPRFDRAGVILSLDSDFLGTDGAVVENIRLFAEGRKLDDNRHQRVEMSRLYVVEAAMTVTGSNADHRIRLRPSAMGSLARALVRAVRGDGSELSALASRLEVDEQLLRLLAEDLRGHRGRALVVAGPHLPEDAHAGVALLNDELRSPGNTLEWSHVRSDLPVNDPTEVEAVFADGVDVAILLDTNPVYDWPGGRFDSLLAKATLSVGHGLHRDETLSTCSIALPSNHNLESWNDAAPRDGVLSICQPVIAPLFNTRQAEESLLVWTQALSESGRAIRRHDDWHSYLEERFVSRLSATTGAATAAERNRRWQNALRQGGAFDDPSTGPFPALKHAATEVTAPAEFASGEFEVVIQPHHAVYDGRFANNGWLQELPDPVSKIVWDNVGSVSEHTAQGLELTEGNMLRLAVGERYVELPVAIQSGLADGVVAVTLGYGRTTGGRIAKQAAGANVALLLGRQDSVAGRLARRGRATKVAGSHALARTQKHFSMHDRPIVLDGTLAEYHKDAGFVEHKRHVPELVTMYPAYDYSKGHKWAMAIDLGACVGCNACVTACQAENNIPIVGREEVSKGREMHWLRIDRYVDGDSDDPVIRQQPMLCQHCDSAPCESVCPVNATTHSPDGLNEMVYNRCVGTRYCANNCPYKVRRFNFSRYHAAELRDPVQELVFNPQVTVRGVGVMEKCTFCVQRINAARFRAKNRGEAVEDGAVRTACQQVCPSKAISFGDLNDAKSEIARMHGSKRAYLVLEEYNIKPNVSYLARVRNPNPSRPGRAGGGHHG